MCFCPEKNQPLHVMPLCRLSRAKRSNKFQFYQTDQARNKNVVCYIGHVFLQFLYSGAEIKYNSLVRPTDKREESLFFCNLLASSQSLRQWRLEQLIWDLRVLTNSRDVTIVLRPSIIPCSDLLSIFYGKNNICLIVTRLKKGDE